MDNTESPMKTGPETITTQGSQSPNNSEVELTEAERRAIKKYMIGFLAMPAIAVGVLTFFLGYFLKDIAYNAAFNQAYANALSQITSLASQATEAKVQAVNARDQTASASETAKTASTQLNELLGNERRDVSQVATTLATQLNILLEKQKQDFSTLNVQITNELLTKPEFLNTLVRTDKLYHIESTLSNYTGNSLLYLDVVKSGSNGTPVEIFPPTPHEGNSTFTRAQTWQFVEQAK